MKKIAFILLLACAVILFESLITRHDIPDEKFVVFAKEFPQICHFENGEGVLLNNGWILTAGHVGKGLGLGINQTVSCNGKNYIIGMVVVHPSFSNLENGLKNDIALVKLSGKLPDIEGLEIYNENDEIGKEITIVGSGDIGNGQIGPRKWDKITRAATNRIDSADEQWISFVFDAPGSKNVTSMEGVSGPGDSGGPAIIAKKGKYYVVGISSHQKGQEKFGKGRYGVTEFYSRVSKHKDWIEVMMYGGAGVAIKDSTVIGQIQFELLKEYTGEYGFRTIILKNEKLFFQRDNEPLISMRLLSDDLFVWDDERTKLQFLRDSSKTIVGFKIVRANGEIVEVKRTK